MTESLLEAYRAGAAYDEMLGRDGAVRASWEALSRAVDRLGPRGLASTRAHAARLLDGDGVVYRTPDSEEAQRWQLDPLPLLLDVQEWAELEPGLLQRAHLLDALLTDLYTDRTVLHQGLLPPEVVLAHSGFLRSCDQLRMPGPHQLFTVAADLARNGDGDWLVLHDRAASPSGAGFAMENRRVVSRVLPGVYRDARIHWLSPFFQAMRLGLQEVAPADGEAPRVVLLTSGPMSETAYDQAFVSQLLGYPLVAGSDLSFREGKIWLRGIDGPEQVDVVLRRLDSDFCDPLELRPESQLGVPGLLEAARLGTVSVVNGLGAGVLENPGLLPYLPALSQALLGEPLRLASAQTWWCGDPMSLSHVRSRLEHLVVKPLSRGTSFVGGALSAGQREDLLARVEAAPHLWVGQEWVSASTVPTHSHGAVEPHSMVLRTFAVSQGGGYHLLPGGLVRVAPHRDSVLVSSQTGALAKDAWLVSATGPTAAEAWVPEGAPAEGRHGVVSPRMAEDFFWLGRYTERAEAATRLLRAVRDRSGDFSHNPEAAGAACLEVLLQVLTTVTATWPGFTGPRGAHRRADPDGELFALVVDPSRPGTLAHSVAFLTQAARGVRDQLSPDTWLVLGGLEAALRELEAAGPDSEVSEVLAGQTLTRALGSLLSLAGLAAESMVRDLGWHFLEAGRRVERAQQVVSLLRASLLDVRSPDVDALVVESALVASESIITFRRRYAPQAEVTTVLELLLVDRENPRSLAHALDRLAGNLGRMPGSAALLHDVEQLSLRVRAAFVSGLAHPVVDGRREELGVFLTDLSNRLRALGRAVKATWFEDVLPPVPLVEVIT